VAPIPRKSALHKPCSTPNMKRKTVGWPKREESILSDMEMSGRSDKQGGSSSQGSGTELDQPHRIQQESTVKGGNAYVHRGPQSSKSPKSPKSTVFPLLPSCGISRSNIGSWQSCSLCNISRYMRHPNFKLTIVINSPISFR
jgi:hypothetical protein